MAPWGPRVAPRGPKSSRCVGVTKRGGCVSLDMRCGGRWGMSGFASEELGGLAHDFFRLLQGVRQYTSLKANKLNFPRDRTFLIRFSERNGMEKFRVVAEGEEKSWGVDKKKDFMELVATALGQIKSRNTVRADDSEEGARAQQSAAAFVRAEDSEEGARAQQSATAFVQGSNDDTSYIRISSGEENEDWDMEGVFSRNDPSSHTWFRSRESEKDMHPRIVELEALLSEEKEKSLVLELENECLHAENQSLKKHLAGVGADQHGQIITDGPVEDRAQSGEAGGTETGMVNTSLGGDQFNAEAELESDFFLSLPIFPNSAYTELDYLPNSSCTSKQAAYPWAIDSDTDRLIDASSKQFPVPENDGLVAGVAKNIDDTSDCGQLMEVDCRQIEPPVVLEGHVADARDDNLGDEQPTKRRRRTKRAS